MPKFAVYYVPSSNDQLYQLGTSFLGYDVRERKLVSTHQELQIFPGFKEEWVRKARPYGFHLTIGDSIDFEYGSILRIEREVSDIIGCLNPKNSLTLKKWEKDFVTFWGPAVVLRYDPNDHLKVLHTLIAARVHPLGSGSGYLQRYLETSSILKEPYHVQRTLMFYSHTIFDSYSPHFTLLHPYIGHEDNKKELANLITKEFSKFEDIELNSICLLVQWHEDKNWIIYKEFKLPYLEQDRS
jgi:hypothetical protein